MKKNIYNITIISLLLISLILILIYSTDVINSVLKASIIWKENIFTVLFPFFILSDLLINYGFINILGILFEKPINKLFNLNKECAFVIILSIFTGSPSNAKYINDLLKNKIINISTAQYLLSFTHYPNPLFVIGIVSNLLGNKLYGYIIFISIMIGNFVIGIFFKRKIPIMHDDKKNKNNYKKIKDNNFVVILTNSILKSFNSLLLILGIITIFLTLSTIICNIFNLNYLSKCIISGILEMTQGIKYISISNISIYLKIFFISFFLSFGGISIHMQVMGILYEFKINYKKYFLSRLIHGFITGFISILIIFIIN